MIPEAMYPILFRVGPITVYSYGAMMALAFLVAGVLVARELKRKGLDPEWASSLVLWAAIGGLLGARLLFIVEGWQDFLRSPGPFLFTGAGFVWYGGLIGGAAAVTWWIRRKGLSWPMVMDCVAPAIALGHGIGRIGCQLAGDGDWGKPTSLPWGMVYSRAIIGWHYPAGVRVHPAPIYESLAYTIIFALLWTMRKRAHVDGSLFWTYLILAGGARFLIELIRINSPVLAGITAAQLMSVAAVAIGGGLLWLRKGVRR